MLMLQQKVNFEPIFVDHGGDWPETYEYLEYFQRWLNQNGHKPITILKPDMGTIEGRRFEKLYDYYHFKKLTPSKKYRSCAKMAKIAPIRKHIKNNKPCFMMIGFAFDESHRAKMAYEKGIENRWPLIEMEITREGCKDIIAENGLLMPTRSGCFFCPFMKNVHVRELRIKHQSLFCKVEQLEEKAVARRGRVAYVYDIPIRSYINEKQIPLLKQDEYPPCECRL